MVGNTIDFIQILSGGLGAADKGGLKYSLSWFNSSTTFGLLHLGYFLDSNRLGAEFPTWQMTTITDKSGNFIRFQVSIHSLTQSKVVAPRSLRGNRFSSNNLANLARDTFSFSSTGFPLNEGWSCLVEFNQWAETTHLQFRKFISFHIMWFSRSISPSCLMSDEIILLRALLKILVSIWSQKL